MNYNLPTSVEVGGDEYQIRTDYRAILDILCAMNDADLSGQEKVAVMLDIFYFFPAWTEIRPEHLQEAVDRCTWFIDCGEERASERKSPKIMDWQQDFPYVAAPISRVVGRDIRGIPYDPKTNEGGFHWWSFISAYYEIGDCFFSQVVGIRNKKAKGKKLDKSEQEFYRHNRNVIDFKTTYTDTERDILKQWGV